MSNDRADNPVAATKTASVLLIGNELLSGRTHDANLPYLAEELNKLGIRVVECRVVPDIEPVIVDAVHALRERSDYVFTTGGIGPTHDDITAHAIAAAFDRKVIRNPEAEALLREYYPADKINEARLKMAETPEGAALVYNPVSTAPGFRVENVFALAGVPDIARAMFDHLKHELVGGAVTLARTVSAHAAEGDIAAGLSVLQERYHGVEIGSYPFFRVGHIGVSIVFRSTDAREVDAAAEGFRDLLADRGLEPIDDTGPVAKTL